jgi:hypothetical protein
LEETDDSLPTMNADVEIEIKEVIGLFDTPSFARRGVELDDALRQLHERCRRARRERLDMVQARLRQWSRAVTDPQAAARVFATPIEPLWPLSEADPPRWAEMPAPIHQQRAIARDLIAAILRFNGRWSQFLDRLNLEPVNHVIDQYNRYYVFEKECVMGSARLASRFFTPVPLLTREQLLRDHPVLPVPELGDRCAQRR